MAAKIRKNDLVEVVCGDYAADNIQKKAERDPDDAPQRKHRGRVIKIDPKKGQIVVEGVNYRVHHEKIRQNKDGEQLGGRTYREAPIDISNVMIVDPETDKPVRVGFKEQEGEKVRYTKGKNASGTILPNEFIKDEKE